jgi:hypothetical protein
MAELDGVRTAFQEGGDNDPVNLATPMHLDTAIVNFGIPPKLESSAAPLARTFSTNRARGPSALCSVLSLESVSFLIV